MAEESNADPRSWKISPGEGAKYWDEWREGGFVAIGWNDLGDVSKLKLDPDNLPALTRRGLCYLNLGKYPAGDEDLSRLRSPLFAWTGDERTLPLLVKNG